MHALPIITQQFFTYKVKNLCILIKKNFDIVYLSKHQRKVRMVLIPIPLVIGINKNTNILLTANVNVLQFYFILRLLYFWVYRINLANAQHSAIDFNLIFEHGVFKIKK